jgi:hypothetical protein
MDKLLGARYTKLGGTHFYDHHSEYMTGMSVPGYMYLGRDRKDSP